jgi:hypothetical protein
MRCLAIVLTLLAGCASHQRRVLTVDDVLRMMKAGVGEKTLVATIETSDVRDKFTLDDIVALKEKGLSDAVVAALVKASGREERVRYMHDPWPYHYYHYPVYAPYWW